MHHKKPKTTSHDASSVALLAVLLIAQLMVILDITAVNIALPSLARDLGIERREHQLDDHQLLVIFGSLLLFGGRAADLLGRRRVFLTGLAVFTGSSLASALAGTAATLFVARAGQGWAQRCCRPAALSIITTAFHGHSGRRRSLPGVRSAVRAPPSASSSAASSRSSPTGG